MSITANLVTKYLPTLLQLRASHAALAALVGNLEGNEQNVALIEQVRTNMAAVAQHVGVLWRGLGRTFYPFDHAKGEITIDKYALSEIPEEDNLGQVYHAGEELLDKLPSLYVRMMVRLVLAAEEVETAIGLPLLPEPPPAQGA